MAIREILSAIGNEKITNIRAIIIIFGAFLLFYGFKIYMNERSITAIEKSLKTGYERKMDSVQRKYMHMIDSVIRAEGDKKANFALIRETEVRQRIATLHGDLNADRVFIIEMHNGGGELSGISEKHITVKFEYPENLSPERSLKTVFTNRALTSGVRAMLTDIMLNQTIVLTDVYQYKPFVNDSVHTRYLKYYNTKSLIGTLVGRDSKNMSMYFLIALWDIDSPAIENTLGKELMMIAAAEDIRRKFNLAPINSAELRRNTNLRIEN